MRAYVRNANIAARLLLVAAGFVSVASSSSGQMSVTTAPKPSSLSNTPYNATMVFDVASVRENKTADLQTGIMMSGQFVPHTTMLRLINWTIENLISYAYGLDQNQIIGASKWPYPTVFVIEAKGDSAADAKISGLTPEQQSAEQRHMLQTLLEDRFKLRVHWETKEDDVYNLVVAKGGPKLGTQNSMQASADELKMFGNNSLPVLRQTNDGQAFDFIAHGCSMAEWSGMLTMQFGRPVVDKTELMGRYDFVVKYKGRWDSDRSADDLDPTPPLDRALPVEIGLRLERAKGPVNLLVVDHVEKPSAN